MSLVCVIITAVWNDKLELIDAICSYSSCSETAEDIQAYVKEVTKELATEIKSEIRDVISKVEDALESTDSLDMTGATMSSLGNIRFDSYKVSIDFCNKCKYCSFQLQ